MDYLSQVLHPIFFSTAPECGVAHKCDSAAPSAEKLQQFDDEKNSKFSLSKCIWTIFVGAATTIAAVVLLIHLVPGSDELFAVGLCTFFGGLLMAYKKDTSFSEFVPALRMHANKRSDTQKSGDFGFTLF